MLTEIPRVKQEPGGRRRWFEDEGIELIVWEDAKGGVRGFQLCYSLDGIERALTWREREGFSHARVDPGDASPLKNQTPILTPDGDVPWVEVTRLFRGRSGNLEAGLCDRVLHHLATRS